MTAIDFPSAPSVNDQFVAGGKTWYWDGVSWNILNPLNATSPILFNAVTSTISLGPIDGGTA